MSRAAPGADPQGEGEQLSERRLFEVLTATNNEMAVLHRSLAQKTRALEAAIARNNEFVGMAAHDLRNPLHVIGGMSRVLLRSTNVNEKERRLLESIAGSSAFMGRLVDDLLQVSELEAGRLTLTQERFSLGEMLMERIDLQRELATDKHISISTRFQTTMRHILGDRMRLIQVVDNLLSNAIKYSHASTSISVHLGMRGGMACVSVRDEGQGIPPGELGNLFRPFGTTSARSTGGEKSTGLGLMIVKRIAEAHGGCVRVRSRVGVGTTFHLLLPCEPESDSRTV